MSDSDSASREGLLLIGVVWSTRRIVAGQWRRDRERRMRLIKYRDVAALVRPVPYSVPEMSRTAIEEHQSELDRVMQRGSVLPAPFGIVFRDRHGVLRFLEDQYRLLDRSLALVEGRWEFRLHVRTEHPELPQENSGPRTRIYGDLRKIANAAMPFKQTDNQVFSAAFLVDRSATSRFVESVNSMTDTYPGITLDLTGPWPAYDFVVIRP